VRECFSQRCVLHCAVRIQHRTVWVSTVCWANTERLSTVCWANTASCEYSLLGKYYKIWVQSVGQLLQDLSTVCWANTASCEYSLLGKYCKIWVQSVGQIMQAVGTVSWANTEAVPILYPAWNSIYNMDIGLQKSVSVQVKVLFGIRRRVAPKFLRSLSRLSSG